MKRIRKHKLPKNDLTGQKFGFLTVIKMAQTEKSGERCNWRAICECENCGNDYFDVAPQSLLRGRTKSCGCDKSRYEKMRGKNSSLYKGCGDISGKLWGTIRRRAEKRGYKLNIDIEYTWDLYQKQQGKCALSGVPIVFGIANHQSSCTTASLDRIDSSKGYVKRNVQWVHKTVNIMKNTFDSILFISLCRRVSDNNIDVITLDEEEIMKNVWKIFQL